MEKILKLIELCKASVKIDANPHRDYYQTVEQWLADNEDYADDVSEEVKAEMIRRDSLITIHFYPHTPIGFIVVAHYDLEMAIDEALATFEG